MWIKALIFSSSLVLGDKIVENNNSSPKPTLSEVIGINKPVGPLSESFQNSHRFPGFPFEFPPIIPGSDKKYLIFPADSAANYLASAKRCGAMGGRLVKLETAVEMEILACSITSPVFIASWMGNDFGGPLAGSCPVLYPGGVIANSPEGCAMVIGSICEVPTDTKFNHVQL